MKLETLGVITFEDKHSGMKATITFGKTKKKPTDYFSGNISIMGDVVQQI